MVISESASQGETRIILQGVRWQTYQALLIYVLRTKTMQFLP